jgi:hypothetical protein
MKNATLTEGVRLKAEKIILFSYFNSKGRRLEQIGLVSNGTTDVSTSNVTGEHEGACALQALIIEVTAGRTNIHLARKIRSVSADSREPIAVADALPELEAKFGVNSVQWAHAIFTHLNLKPPSIQ